MKNSIASALLATLCVACGSSSDDATHAAAGLTGSVSIDGSSTVFPITEAVAEEYRLTEKNVRVTIGVSGTGGGFKKFMAGETDISNASRYIKQKEIDGCAAAKMEFIELPVAFDGLAVVVNPKNEFVKSMTIAELRSLWAADSAAKLWSDIRADWPDRPFHLFAPGQDSGTFDYFTDVVNGESGNCRSDVTFSEDDNVLVRGVIGDPDGLAFFGLAYYVENKGELSCVAIDGGSGPVTPSAATVESGEYSPLSRPLFIYVSTAAAERPEVNDFVRFYLEKAGYLAGEVGYVPLPAYIYEGLESRFEKRVIGSEVAESGTLGELYL